MAELLTIIVIGAIIVALGMFLFAHLGVVVLIVVALAALGGVVVLVELAWETILAFIQRLWHRLRAR